MTPMDKNALADQSYFGSVVDEMRKKGFVFFSQVAVSTDDVAYHVQVAYARDTRLFFHYPNTNCIVTLSYREHDYGEENGFNSYWYLRLDLKYREISPYNQMMYRGASCEHHDDDLSFCEDNFDTRDEDRDDKFQCSGFHCCGWSSHSEKTSTWNLEQSEYWKSPPLKTTDLACQIYDALKDHLPLLAAAPFEELQVTSWSPSYSFPGCSPMFWDRFKESSADLSTPRYLWSLVIKPWGSKGLKR